MHCATRPSGPELLAIVPHALEVLDEAHGVPLELVDEDPAWPPAYFPCERPDVRACALQPLSQLRQQIVALPAPPLVLACSWIARERLAGALHELLGWRLHQRRLERQAAPIDLYLHLVHRHGVCAVCVCPPVVRLLGPFSPEASPHPFCAATQVSVACPPFRVDLVIVWVVYDTVYWVEMLQA